MPDFDDLDEFLESLLPMSDPEQVERMLNYFNGVFRTCDTASLRELRAHLLALHTSAGEEPTVIQTIDGLIALREMEK